MTRNLSMMHLLVAFLLAFTSLTAAKNGLTVIEHQSPDGPRHSPLVATADGVVGYPNRIIFFNNDVYDDANQVIVGYNQGFCSETIFNTQYECHFTFAFTSGGSLTANGPYKVDSSPTVLAINGGTGKYVKVRGEIVMNPSVPQPLQITYEINFA
eukprot:TRINITY_DN20342_c0_g1_i1.p1 TRINITY_DN20342_c0_g1~~TRINITY_DN20342_c0_g1_i1.p1  ORF type:complete len:155 (+),score=23.70 TRINITY_DN20342_c0_g1_i1:124-588(+)